MKDEAIMTFEITVKIVTIMEEEVAWKAEIVEALAHPMVEVEMVEEEEEEMEDVEIKMLVSAHKSLVC
jgi:hypothetical protein